MKILIVKLSSIGDVVHTLPAFAAIRNALPDAEISWVVEKRVAEILRRNELLDNLIEIDTKSLRKKDSVKRTLLNARLQLRKLRSEQFDVAIDFQGLIKSAAIAKIAKAKLRFGFTKKNLREPASRFLLTDKIKVKKKMHIIRKNLELAAKALDFEISDENIEFPIFTRKKHKKEADEIIEKTGENFAILNPAGGWVTKLWHAEKYGMLADRLWEEMGITSVISTAPKEIDLAKKALRASNSGRVILAQPSLKGFYELAKQAKIYVGGDTAPTHLAVAAKTPIVGIFGPTEWWRNGSPDPRDICVARQDIGCRVDCHRRTCDKWICMDIDVETVFDAIKKRLREASISASKASKVKKI